MERVRRGPSGWARRGIPLVVFVLVTACGATSSAPTAPTVTETTPTSSPTPISGDPTVLAAGTSLSVVAGDTDLPVAGVTIHVGAGTYLTDGGGRVVLTERIPVNSPIDFVSPTILDRLTVVRSASTTKFVLWPKTGALDEAYTRTLVYTPTTDDAFSTTALKRISRTVTSAVVVPSLALQADGEAMAMHQAAAAEMNLVQDRVRYSIASAKPATTATTLVIETLLDPQDPRCGETTRGFAHLPTIGDEITLAAIVFCRPDAARTATVLHELGHTFGLRHAPESSEVMFASFTLGRATTFGPRERATMRMMLERPAGNLFPDNDRSVRSTAVRRDEVIVCR